MTRTYSGLAILLPLSACTIVQSPFSETLSAAGLDRVEASIESGSVELRAGGPDIVVDGLSWGMAGGKDRASEERDANRWDVVTAAGGLLLSAQSAGGGVDFSVTAPAHLDSQLVVASGDATLTNMRGVHVVDACNIHVQGVSGYVDLYAEHDITGRLTPLSGDTLILTSEWGDVDIRLPWGAPIDLVVWADPSEVLVVEDLGFHSIVTAPGYFAARSGPGTILVDVFAPEGEVRISSTW